MLIAIFITFTVNSPRKSGKKFKLGNFIFFMINTIDKVVSFI